MSRECRETVVSTSECERLFAFAFAFVSTTITQRTIKTIIRRRHQKTSFEEEEKTTTITQRTPNPMIRRRHQKRPLRCRTVASAPGCETPALTIGRSRLGLPQPQSDWCSRLNYNNNKTTRLFLRCRYGLERRKTTTTTTITWVQHHSSTGGTRAPA